MESKEISEQQNKLLYEGERERERIDALTIVTLEKYNHNVVNAHINTCITNREREREGDDEYIPFPILPTKAQLGSCCDSGNIIVYSIW